MGHTMQVTFNQETLGFSIKTQTTTWQWDQSFQPYFVIDNVKTYFNQAQSIHHQVENNLMISRYQFETFSFKTIVYTNDDDEVFFEFEEVTPCAIDKVFWPGPMSFNQKRSDWLTYLNYQQGLMIPNDWEYPLTSLVFDGLFNTAAAYMPWIAQSKPEGSYLCTCLTPWDAGYRLTPPANQVGFYLNKSLGKISYKRIFRYTFFEGSDINIITKRYRQTVEKQKHFKTLLEKKKLVPHLSDLVGSVVVHTGIKTNIEPDSRMFKDDSLNKVTPYSDILKIVEQAHDLGVNKLYLHLDGWAQPGYDNQHPDYNQAVIEAGGWQGFKDLVKGVQEKGYLFGLHDQYRDYYFKAPSFDLNKAVLLEDGGHPIHSYWAGGQQTYLCSAFVLDYVKRNFEILKNQGINLDAAYLDVFTCNEADECFNKAHQVSRRQGYQHRLDCFSYLLDHQLLSSSEEVNEWALESLVFCHYAPYDFMLREPGSKKFGIPIPLFNMVYHDCVIIPWMMENHEDDDYFLYALLNGGIPYLRRDGAYQNIDGSFESQQELEGQEHLKRSQIVSELHQQVAYQKIENYRIDGDIHQTTFSNKIVVSVNLKSKEYNISQK